MYMYCRKKQEMRYYVEALGSTAVSVAFKQYQQNLSSNGYLEVKASAEGFLHDGMWCTCMAHWYPVAKHVVCHEVICCAPCCL